MPLLHHRLIISGTDPEARRAEGRSRRSRRRGQDARPASVSRGPLTRQLQAGHKQHDRRARLRRDLFPARLLLPVSFFEHALRSTGARDRYAAMLARLLLTKRPKSKNCEARSHASFALVPRQSNKFGACASLLVPRSSLAHAVHRSPQRAKRAGQ